MIAVPVSHIPNRAYIYYSTHGGVDTWQVMEAPTGQRFCVVRAQSKDFDKLATEWP